MDNQSNLAVKEILKSVGAIGAVIILLLVLAFGGMSFYTVGAGHCGVEFDRLGGGVKNTTFGEGTHFKTPIIESSAVYDTRIQKYSRETSAASNDLQDVEIKTTVNYHINDNECDEMHQEIGTNYEKRVIDPTIKEVVKSVSAKYDASAIIQNRSAVKKDVDERLEKRLGRNYVYLDEVSIENIRFTDEFKEAIEQKEIAKQNAQEARNRLEQVKAEAEQKKEEARGQAAAIKEVTEQLKKSDSYIKFKMIEKWDGETNTIVPYVSGDGDQSELLMQLPRNQTAN